MTEPSGTGPGEDAPERENPEAPGEHGEPGKHEEDLPDGHGAACGIDGEQRLAAEGEVAVARLAIDGGDLAHAASHLGFALAQDPRLPEAHEALAQLAARCGGPAEALELFPTEKLYIGAAACRAHLFAAAGQWAEALDLLAAIMSTQPDRPWAHVAWLSRPDLPQLLAPEVIGAAAAKLMSRGLPGRLPQELRETVAPFYDFVRAAAEQYPDSPGLMMMASGLARRFGDVALGVGWAERARELEPGYVQSVMLGYALREAERVDDALAVWQEAIGLDPSDPSLYVDIAELYAGDGRAAEGVAWLERALAIDPEHPKAAPAIHSVRFAADQDPAHLVALTDHLRAHPEHGYAYTLLEQMCRGRAWLGSVHSATEATVNALHQFLESGNATADSEVQMSVSSLEPPSALMSFQLVLPKVTAVYQEVGDPDPREPGAEVSVQAWRYDGLTAEPAVAPPSAEAAETIRGIAQLRWPHPLAAYDHAVHLSGLALDDLLGALVHPPAFRDDDQGRFLAEHLPDLWVRAVQVFACLGIAHHRPDEPWLHSTRRDVLTDLLYGPEDWITEAAAMALLAVAWVDPEAREDVGAWIAGRMMEGAKAFQTRVVTILGSLARITLACPWLAEDFTSLAQQVLDVVEQQNAEESEDDEGAEADEADEADKES